MFVSASFQQHCASVPVYVTKRLKETECQQCQRYYETAPTTKYVRQCNPIFDEKCSTEYIRHCKTTQRCLMIYQTVCNSQGYEQHCTNEVGDRPTDRPIDSGLWQTRKTGRQTERDLLRDRASPWSAAREKPIWPENILKGDRISYKSPQWDIMDTEVELQARLEMAGEGGNEGMIARPFHKHDKRCTPLACPCRAGRNYNLTAE